MDVRHKDPRSEQVELAGRVKDLERQLAEFEARHAAELERTGQALQEESAARMQNEALLAESNQALKAANERLKSILGSITEAYFALDDQYRFLEINRVAEEMLLHHPEGELLGRGFWDVFPDGVGSEFYHQYHRAVEQGVDVHFEGRSTLVDKWFEVHAYPRGGRLEVYFRDITARKLAEERLAYQARLLENVHDAVIAMDANFMITSWNRAAEELYGWKAEEVIGRRAIEVTRTQISQEQRQEIIEREARGDSYRIELLSYRKDGTPVYVETTSLALFDDQGHVSGYVTAGRNVTGRREMEALLQSRNQALEAGAEALRGARDELEQRVSERTRELQAANQQLAMANEDLRREIAERRRAEAQLEERSQALQASEGLFRQVLEFLPVGVWVADRNGRLILGNPAGKEIWSGTRNFEPQHYSEFKGWRLDTGRLLEPDEWGSARALQHGEITINEEIEVECFDGTHKMILNSAIPLRDAKGDITGAIIVNEDITERKRAEQELRASQEQLRAVVNAAPVILWAINREGEMTLLEGKALSSIGLSPGEKGAQEFKQRLSHRPDLQEHLQRAQAGEEVSGVLVISGDGKESFEAHYAPFYDLDGRQDGVIGVSIQITERLRAERALRQANQELEQSNTDLETRVAERTVQLGQAIRRLGQAYRRLARTNRQLQQAKQDLEWELAERMRAEDALEAYALQLERTNRDLQDFASIASHDLQEPLRKIQAFGDRLLQGTAAGKLNAEERDYLDRLVRSAASMSAMIRDLLAYSRLSTLAQPAAPIDLAAVAREVLSNLEVRIERTGGSVEIGDLPLIEADPLQMRQLLQNLIGNALKYQRPGVPPVVRVWSRPPTADDGRQTADGGQNSSDEATFDPSFRTTDQIEIIVEDNGIGFDEEYAERIFQPFQRLVGRSEYEGSGMGLAICRKIVERHRGSITAAGVPGQGAKFIIRLPVKQTAEL